MNDRIILNTKLYIPAVKQNQIFREDLNKKLNESLLGGHRIILISAAAGYGKTTFTSGWLSQLDYSCTWFSMDKYDSDPSRFINYLTAAVQKIDSKFGKTIEDLMTAPKLPGVEVMSSYIIKELEQIKEQFILVLDDYHVIDCSYIHELMQKLLDYPVANVITVILTRHDPPFTLPRWRGRDRITEVRAEDLKFDGGEIEEFFSRYFDTIFDDDILKMIEEQTEGWAAGLQLTGLSVKNMGKSYARSFVLQHKGNNRFITDYLMEEILERQEGRIRDFLTKTCMLKRFTAELCDYMTGNGDGRGILEQLERENLFIVPLDSSRIWYRYHHLFSEFLRAGMDEEKKAEMCKKASLWCRENGFAEEALEYALEAKDGELAASLVKAEAVELFQKGELKTLLSWLNSIAEIKEEKEGILETYRAWCLQITGQIDEASKVFDSLKDMEESGSDPIIIGMAKAATPFRYNLEDKELAIKNAEEAIAYVKDKQELFYYGALIALGHANVINGHTAESAALYAKVHEGAQRKGYRFLEVLSLFNLAFYLNCMGKRREALALCERTLERGTDQNGNHLPMAKIAYLPMGMLLYCSNKLEEARKYLEEGIACYRELGFAHLAGLGEWYLVLLLYGLGEKERAFGIAYKLKACFKNFIAPQVAVFFEALEIELQLREGNVERAAQWLRESETVLDGVSGLQDINPYFTYMRTMIFQRNFRDAGAALEEKEALVRKEGRYWELITVLVLSALIEKNLGKEEEALSRIREALAIAAPEGYARSFLDEGNEVLELVRKVRDAAPEFVDKLTGEEAKKAGKSTEPLKKREIEILGLIAKGMSNDEISEKLYITTGTTKWHIKNIFAKLGVKKRTQAVNKAKQLNIIG